jgi:hypothetical protein
MNRFLLLALAFVMLASSAFAITMPCAPALMSTYMAPGFSCMINALTFSGFGYSGTALGTGVAVPASSVLVTPIATPGDATLQFAAPWGVSSVGGIGREDSLITYTAMSPAILDLEVGFGGEIVSGTGSASVVEHYCLGELAALPCTHGGTPGTIAVTDPPSSFTNHVFFAPQTVIGLSKDIMLDSGTAGTAIISQVTNSFSTPEPISLVLLGSGLLGLGLMRKRIKR